jgi:exodeoxyribonuclease VII large subunit
MQEMIFTVDKICGYVKNIFDNESLLHDIRISGEISDYGESGGNAYFVLKGSQSQLNCVYFAPDLRAFIPKDGEKCIVKGSVTFYKKGGKISFYVTDIMPYGQGLSYIKFLELKDRLEKEGVFDAAHKIPLPEFISRIGVVTSRSGAVIHDIINVASKKYSGIDIVLYSVKVQGAGAEKEIAEGLRTLDKSGVDVIIVARGGGSAEDLSAFNTETVAKAVYNCRTCIVSAVGHETDYTLCDIAADVRAATPTEAAEITTPDAKMLSDNIYLLMSQIEKRTAAIYSGAYDCLNSQIKSISSVMGAKIDKSLSEIKYRLFEISNRAEGIFRENTGLFNALAERINALSPLKVLQRGYSYITDQSGNTVKSVAALKPMQLVNITFKDGKAIAEIKKINEDNKLGLNKANRGEIFEKK